MRIAPWLMIIATIGVFALRLFIAFSDPGLSADDNAYFHLRQIEQIRETGFPLYDDPLSFGGRTYIFSPVFHYLIALSSLLMPLGLAVKVMPNLLAALLIPVIYGIARKLSRREGVVLFTAIFSAFVPVWFTHTISTLSPMTLAIPLLFFVIYAWLRSNETSWRYVYLISLFILAFSHPLSLFLVAGLMLYLILILVEQMKSSRTEIEITLFSIFFVLWSQFLLYKKFILAHGPAVVWQNIPPTLLSGFFSNVTILTAIYQIGILPVLYGVFVVYRYLFRRKHRMTYFLIAFTLAAGIALWFRLIPLLPGLMLLGMFLILLFSRWVDFYIQYITTTRFHRWRWLLVLSLILAFIFTSIVPSWFGAWSIQETSLDANDLRAYDWLRSNLNADEVVLAPVSEGHRITALAQRKNIVDTHFLLQRDAKQRVQDVHRIYSTQFGVEAVELMDRYGASVILVSPETKRNYGIETLEYTQRSACFGTSFEEGGYTIIRKHPFCAVEVQ